MLASVRAMFSGIVDYAGIFPPAQLPLEQAIRNYARYRTEPESWMLGRFVCPAARLHELSRFVEELFQAGPPLAISVLGRSGKGGSDFIADLRADLECLTAFAEQHRNAVKPDVLESRIPAQLVSDCFPVSDHWLYAAGRIIDDVAPSGMRLFLEASLDGDWLKSVEELKLVIAAANRGGVKQGIRKRLRCRPIGFKLRCGGTESSAFPTIGQVFFALAHRREVPFKATAGLHYPLRHFDSALDTYMHGFLNLWIAAFGVSRKRHEFDELKKDFDISTIPALLEDECASNFVFTDGGVRWRELTIPTHDIVSGRSSVTSFGSCSFDEPREGLRELGLIP